MYIINLFKKQEEIRMVKQTFIASISFLFLLVIFIPTIHAEEGQTFKVGTDTLEMKAEPAQNAETIGHLNRGDKLTIFQEKFGWVQTYSDGKEVWVASQYLLPINAEKDTSDSVSEQEPDVKTKKPAKDDNSKRTDSKKSKDSENSEDSKDTKDSSNKVEENNHPSILGNIKDYVKNLDEWEMVDSRDVISDSIEISTNHNQPLSGYHIVIDPGHGGKDPGAKADGVIEKKLTLSTAKIVAEKLQDEGATVTLTRSDDSYVSLEKRVQISNAQKTDAFISLHFNAFSDPAAKGINTFYYAGEKDIKLAKSIQESLMNHVNLNNRGAKYADYYVLRENSDVAVLVELGFITNPDELKKVQTTQYQKKVSEGIAEGLKDYFSN